MMAASIHTGHRQRAKREFLARGLNGLADHRVLELLLYYAIPQGDVNPLAHALIDRFGSLAGVLNATYEDLVKVKGVGENTATLIRLLPAVSARYLEENSRVGWFALADAPAVSSEPWMRERIYRKLNEKLRKSSNF